MGKEDQKQEGKREVKFDMKKLSELPKSKLEVPKAPSVYKDKKDESQLKDHVEFSLKNEFDTSTYWGRFKSMFTSINPLLFFVTNKTIEECRDKYLKYQMREEAAEKIGAKVYMKPEEIKEIKYASRVVNSAVHPDTNQIIPFYMRMSGFVIFNIPLVFAVTFVRNQTPQFNAMMQWANQTYNAGMNYGNRNASSSYTISDLARGYFGAVLVSVGIALYTRTAFASQLNKLHGSKKVIANSGLNYVAGALAGASNLFLMRFKELQEGIQIQNKQGDETYGQSKVAAKKAILETAITRVFLPIPVLFFPAIANFLLERSRLWPKNNIAAKLLELSLVCVSLTFALPMSVALFERRSKIYKDQLEQEFQDIKSTNTGDIVQEFYFNKGL